MNNERRIGKDRRKLKRICFGAQKSGRRKNDVVDMICCICKMIKSNGTWKKKEASPSDVISRGYCSSCVAHAVEMIKKDSFYREERTKVQV